MLEEESMDHITLIVHDITGCTYDVEAPLDITAEELIVGLHKGLNHYGQVPKAIRSENPTSFLIGDRLLSSYGLRDGSNLYFYGEEDRL